MEFANVLRHDLLPFSILRLILAVASRTAREGALGGVSCRGANLNFRAIPTPAQPTIWPQRFA
jgi:hypothetical protein